VKILCDMDGVVVKQTGRDGFDRMPWMPDGRALWEFIAPLKPTMLSMLPDDSMKRCEPQKREWCARELGPDVAVIITPDSRGKSEYATRGAVLIDDSVMHADGWARRGGIFVRHTSARDTIARLQALMA
jgi:hypothetical protein